MADELTPKLGLIKPEVGGSDDTWGDKTNANWDLLDLLLPPDWSIFATDAEVAAGYAPISHTHTASQITDFSEATDDRVAGLLVAGTNVTLNYNDPANTLTINSTASGVPATAVPLVESGTGAVGVSTKYAREDHVHPLGPGGGGGASVTISDTPPGSPTAGNLWWESDTGNLYIYYNDGNSSQWVLVVPNVSATSIGAVAYTPQTLTAPQQLQARQNIGAASPVGVTDGSNAVAGNVGEFVTSVRTRASGVALTTNVAVNLTSITLSAGDWDVFGVIGFSGSATATNASVVGGSSSTTGTLPGLDSGQESAFPSLNLVALDCSIPFPMQRFSLASTTTIFLVALSAFSVGAVTAYGTISARRRR